MPVPGEFRSPLEPESAPLRFQASGLRKTYRLGAVTIEALCGVDLVVSRGEFLVVAGPSGCGKTSLFKLLGGLDAPDSCDDLLCVYERCREIGCDDIAVPTTTPSTSCSAAPTSSGLSSSARRSRLVSRRPGSGPM